LEFANSIYPEQTPNAAPVDLAAPKTAASTIAK